MLFRSLASSDRKELWRDALGPHPSDEEPGLEAVAEQFALGPADIGQIAGELRGDLCDVGGAGQLWQACRRHSRMALDGLADRRSEERPVGKKCVSTFRCRWSPYL